MPANAAGATAACFAGTAVTTFAGAALWTTGLAATGFATCADGCLAGADLAGAALTGEALDTTRTSDLTLFTAGFAAWFFKDVDFAGVAETAEWATGFFVFGLALTDFALPLFTGVFFF